VRYVVVGLGNIGGRRRALLGDRCVATVDPFNPAADHKSLDACGVDGYDAVVLAVPNDVKVALVENCLARGKHVLVEKPLVLPDRATAERLHALARTRGVTWYTAYNHRFEALVPALKRHLDAGAIGRVYHGRFFYGNGTVRNVVDTWREQGAGVIDDLVPHLLDLADYLVGCRGVPIVPWSVERHEARVPDHCVLATADGRLVFEASFLSWRNACSIDLYGEGGSVHLRGLVKWGGSCVTVRRRVVPSGMPHESSEERIGPDESWQLELEHFERLCASSVTSMEGDWWISETIRAAVA
jgi:scyllo-inositol 2-dehydrogenase (NADP+)